jgi:hypothetical protein
MSNEAHSEIEFYNFYYPVGWKWRIRNCFLYCFVPEVSVHKCFVR